MIFNLKIFWRPRYLGLLSIRRSNKILGQIFFFEYNFFQSTAAATTGASGSSSVTAHQRGSGGPSILPWLQIPFHTRQYLSQQLVLYFQQQVR